MLQKVLKFANYAVAVLVEKIMLFCSSYAKNYMLAQSAKAYLAVFPALFHLSHNFAVSGF